VPGGTGSGGSGGDGDEAVWLDLVARFHAPVVSEEAPPWPDRENLAGPVRVTPATPPTAPPSVPEALPREPPTNPTGLPGLPGLAAIPPAPDAPVSERPVSERPVSERPVPERPVPDQPVPGPSAPDRPAGRAPDDTLPDQPWPGFSAGRGPRDAVSAGDPADDHYIPPVPPPLPRLDPVTKIAWLALFGGPLYLLISTATGAAISGPAAFLAVAAFVGGFVVLVLRMDNGRPPDSGSGSGDGAVV
jgi:hypothetical protein